MTRRGFTLLETLIALGILGLALVSMVVWLAKSATFERRLDLHRLAIRELEAQHEDLRSGTALPGVGGTFTRAPITDISDLEAPVIRMTVSAPIQAGLYEVDFLVSYRIGNQKFERRLDVLTWRP